MKKILFATLLFVSVLATQATLYTTNWTGGFANGGVVPDNNYSGWADSRTLNAAPAGNVTPGSVAVTLNLSGGWNGDLYAYLVNSSSGFCVLLDQIGTGTYGNAGNGFNVTLSAAGTPGLGSYMDNGTGLLTGTWQPDNTSGSLSSFTTQGGTWSLFIADLSAGGVTTVQSWGLQMDIVAVPEVETWVAAALAGAFGAFWLNRQIWGSKPA
jgi:subtilisin-like proprotein convertase family protein